MKYKKIGEELYLRLDKNDEIMESIQYLCEKENILFNILFLYVFL